MGPGWGTGRGTPGKPQGCLLRAPASPSGPLAPRLPVPGQRAGRPHPLAPPRAGWSRALPGALLPTPGAPVPPGGRGGALTRSLEVHLPVAAAAPALLAAGGSCRATGDFPQAAGPGPGPGGPGRRSGHTPWDRWRGGRAEADARPGRCRPGKCLATALGRAQPAPPPAPPSPPRTPLSAQHPGPERAARCVLG